MRLTPTPAASTLNSNAFIMRKDVKKAHTPPSRVGMGV